MTVCAVTVQENEITMGADGLGSNNFDIISQHREKLLRINEGTISDLMCACAGDTYLITTFRKLLTYRSAMRSNDWLFDTKENYLDGLNDLLDDFAKEYMKDPEDGFSCIIASQTHLCCHVITNKCIREVHAGDYAAIGSGDDVAIGALYATRDVRVALAATCKHKLHCGGDCKIIVMRRK